jgi:preprotein translocase subunit YajC
MVSTHEIEVKLMRTISGLLIGAALAVSAPALAQAQPAITVGMQVTDPNGGPVGTVTAIQGDNLQVKTGKHETLVPKASFAVSEGKLLLAMTQAELDAAIEKSLAAADASVAAGAPVKGVGGADIGKIDSVTTSDVVIALPSGKKVQVARNGVRGNADGTVTVGLTAEQIEAATQGSNATAPKGK